MSTTGGTYELSLDQQPQPIPSYAEEGYTAFSYSSVQLTITHRSETGFSPALVVDTYLYLNCSLLPSAEATETANGHTVITADGWAAGDERIVSPDGYCVQRLTPTPVSAGLPDGKSSTIEVGGLDLGFVSANDQTGRVTSMLATPMLVQFGIREVGADGTAPSSGAFFSPRTAVRTEAETTSTISAATSVPIIDAMPTTSTPSELVASADCPNGTSPLNEAPAFSTPPPVCIDASLRYVAVVSTNFGDFAIELDAQLAPIAVNNFVVLSRYGYYDNTICHRVVKDFVVQCGDPTGTGTGGPGYSLPDELPPTGAYQIGTVAMANSGPNTAGSQFFIVTGELGTQLPSDYTIIGRVVIGMDTTVAAMAAQASADSTSQSPVSEVRVTSIRVQAG